MQLKFGVKTIHRRLFKMVHNQNIGIFRKSMKSFSKKFQGSPLYKINVQLLKTRSKLQHFQTLHLEKRGRTPGAPASKSTPAGYQERPIRYASIWCESLLPNTRSGVLYFRMNNCLSASDVT